MYSRFPIRLEVRNIVGVIQSRSGMQFTRRPSVRKALHAVELRLDALDFSPTERDVAALKLAVIATARHPSEGGVGNLGSDARKALLFGALEWASAIDIELRSMEAMRDIVEEARQRGIVVIGSFHDFNTTPSAERLVELQEAACEQGVHVLKVATTVNKFAELLRLAGMFEFERIPQAVMGMGAFGKASRVVLGALGSVLNYGWLENPQVTGQWSALELARRLEDL